MCFAFGDVRDNSPRRDFGGVSNRLSRKVPRGRRISLEACELLGKKRDDLV